MALEFGVVGGLLKMRLKPSFSQSLVTPVQGVGGPALQYSTRIHGPVIFVGAAGWFVSSPISGNWVPAAQFAGPASILGLTQPLLPTVPNPAYSVVPPVVSVTAPFWNGSLPGLLNVGVLGSWTSSASSTPAPRSGWRSATVSAMRIRICALLY